MSKDSCYIRTQRLIKKKIIRNDINNIKEKNNNWNEKKIYNKGKMNYVGKSCKAFLLT